MLLKMQGLRQSYDVVRTVNKSDCYKWKSRSRGIKKKSGRGCRKFFVSTQQSWYCAYAVLSLWLYTCQSKWLHCWGHIPVAI